ncbi:MAG: amidase [Chloroflexota bacterium]
MSSQQTAYMPALEMLKHFQSGSLSPVEVAQSALERIASLNDEYGVFITVTEDRALAAAKVAEEAYRKGEAIGAVAGVPVGIKDLTPTKGVRTTMGSLLHEHDVPDESAPEVERLNTAGMVMIGKTNTPEFGWKGDSGNRILGPTRNPWDRSRTAGGSSGGAGAAVALGICPLAQGSDGAGSIRIPSSFCGIFGLKPSTGLVPRYPSRIPPYSHVGPMTRTVRDAALLLTVTAGSDPRDRYSWDSGIDYLSELRTEVKGLKVAWSPDLGYANVHPEVSELSAAAARRFEDLGCEVSQDHPKTGDPWPIMEVIFMMSQLESHIDDFEDVRSKLDPGRVTLLDRARRVTGERFLRALRDWDRYYHEVRTFMDGYDLLLTPTIATTPFAAGEDKPGTINGKSTTYLGWTGFSYPFNLTGQPAASVPCGFTASGLPVGLQIVGRHRDDLTVLNAAAAFEEANPWSDFRPL